MITPSELESRLKSSFPFFLAQIWKHLNLPVPTPVQIDIAKYLQTGDKRIIIEAYRGAGKSFITSAFVVWCLYRDPQMRIMVVSASGGRADAFSQFTKRLIDDITWLQHLKPRGKQRDSMFAFDVGPAENDHSPSVKSVGITGQLTGSRADLIIADDIEVLNNSATQTAREKLMDLISEFDAILKPLPSARIVYLGTPQTQESIYNKLPEKGYKPRIWPALYPSRDEIEQYQGKLAPFVLERLERGGEVGKTMDPDRFTDEDLEERRLSYGKAGFNLQFMLNTALTDAEKYPLKLADLMIMNCSPDRAPVDIAWSASPDLILHNLPNSGMMGDRFYRPKWQASDWIPYTGCVMAIDPSGRGKDETAYAVVKMLNGYMYLVDAGGIDGGYDDRCMKAITKMAIKHKVNEIVVESNFGDGMFNELLKPHLTRSGHPVTLSEVRATAMKEARIIDTLEPVMMQHRLIIDEGVVARDMETAKTPEYSLFWQMTRICNERGAISHDDRLDALAMAVNYWLEQVAVDAASLERDRQEELQEEMLDAFLNGVLCPQGKQTYDSKGKMQGYHSLDHRERKRTFF